MKIIICILFLPSFIMAQKDFKQVLKQYNDESIPYITVQELQEDLKQNNLITILDARQIKEYQISHLANAIYVGSKDFNIELTKDRLPKKDEPIVVYCSIGVRSEKIAKKLKDAGYKNVKNLYGGIFEWKNNGFTVYNLQSQPTDSVHTYSKKWSNYLQQGIKVY
ncbi:rhodanese-related sulfurtransferase [Mesonia algae]|uniref:Rhodanese-related sulfurtransferase n=1 Tax=Mesonia algae TaxID=213248 RepID=A0A2W7IWP4_9FLAO|nr:rhodanese-like domain-containing protein [Mesonia algae]PZW43917.1 rhodanese-related sulfurtransferase [Mesonia algae]